MKWLEEFIKKYPIIQSSYEQKVIEGVKQEKDELKAKVPDHRWWESDDIDAMTLDLSPKEKDRLRTSELHSAIMKTMEKKGIDSIELKKIMDDLESTAKTLNDHDQKETEIMLLEGLINTFISSPKIYDQFYKILGPELRKMCDSNNSFWVRLGEKNKKEQDEAYALLVEEKKIEDAKKSVGNA